MPLIIQYNKRDLPDALPVEELEAKLNPWGKPVLRGRGELRARGLPHPEGLGGTWFWNRSTSAPVRRRRRVLVRLLAPRPHAPAPAPGQANARGSKSHEAPAPAPAPSPAIPPGAARADLGSEHARPKPKRRRLPCRTPPGCHASVAFPGPRCQKRVKTAPAASAPPPPFPNPAASACRGSGSGSGFPVQRQPSGSGSQCSSSRASAESLPDASVAWANRNRRHPTPPIGPLRLRNPGRLRRKRLLVHPACGSTMGAPLPPPGLSMAQTASHPSRSRQTGVRCTACPATAAALGQTGIQRRVPALANPAARRSSRSSPWSSERSPSEPAAEPAADRCPVTQLPALNPHRRVNSSRRSALQGNATGNPNAVPRPVPQSTRFKPRSQTVTITPASGRSPARASGSVLTPAWCSAAVGAGVARISMGLI